MKLNNIVLNLPPKIKIIIWLNKNNKNILKIFLFNDKKKINMYFNNKQSDVIFDKWCNSIVVKNRFKSDGLIKIENFFLKFFKSWDVYFFSKLKFKGKGFRIRFLKKLKLVKFFFGKSHKSFIFFKKIILKRINKYKFIIKNIKKEKVITNSNMVTNIRPINFYTLRGLRKSRQIIFKRKGKKGTYI